MSTTSRRRLVTAALVAVPLVAVPAPPSGATSVPLAVSGRDAVAGQRAVLSARTLVARPGYRRTARGPVLDTMRFTTVAQLSLPATPVRRTVVLGATMRVEVPRRIALSVRAWCTTTAATARAPGRGSAADVLVVGQNPVPGRSAVQVASRRLTGRAVVEVPAARAARCVLQMSPRTESTTGSTLRLRSGTFTATPAVVVARAAERESVLVGPPVQALGQTPVRRVAALGPVAVRGAVRVEGEAELTTCALGYHRCPRGRAGTSVVDVRLVLADLDAAGRTCRIWSGSPRRVTITAEVHHVKVVVPPAAPRGRCGTAVRTAVEIRHRSGDAVEVEPVLGLGGEARRVQTHLWLQRS
jgi:hypothetical protein